MRYRVTRSYRSWRQRRRAIPNPTAIWQVVDPGVGGTWTGRHVAVTGAAGLLGSHVVAALVQRGAIVHAIDVDESGLQHLSVAHPSGITNHVADLTDRAAIDTLTTDLTLDTDSLDALIHCVGFNDHPTPGAGPDEASWQRVLSTNLVAPAQVTEGLLPLLARVQGAGIVMVTSLNGRTTSPWPHYAAAKAGLAKLTIDLAARLAPQSIRVNAVAPGWFVATTDDVAAPADPAAPLINSALPVAAVVNAVLFLADPSMSPCTTGQELCVDGGAEVAAAFTARQRV